MKKIFASAFVALLSFPIAGFACGGGDCSGMELPPPEVPAPGPTEQLLGAAADHAGLIASCLLATALVIAFSRQRKLLATKSAAFARSA